MSKHNNHPTPVVVHQHYYTISHSEFIKLSNRALNTWEPAERPGWANALGETLEYYQQRGGCTVVISIVPKE